MSTIKKEQQFFYGLSSSYKKTVSTMDVRTVRPFTELDVFPYYSKYYLDFEYDVMLRNPTPILLNSCVSRSMLVMRMIDHMYSNSSILELSTSINQYHQCITKLFSVDPVSDTGKCLPNNYEYRVLKDICQNLTLDTLSESRLKSMSKAYALAMNLSYEIFQDIFADNSYECTGYYYIFPFYFTIKSINLPILTSSHSLLQKTEYLHLHFIQYYVSDREQISKGSGGIDLFGHDSVILPGNPSRIQILDGDFNFIEDITPVLSKLEKLKSVYQQYKSNTCSITHHLQSRLYRWIHMLAPEVLEEQCFSLRSRIPDTIMKQNTSYKIIFDYFDKIGRSLYG